MSKIPAPMITNPAARNCPVASSTAAPALITNPRKVSTLGWILDSASPCTIRRITLLQVTPIARVAVIAVPLSILSESGSAWRYVTRQFVNSGQLENLHFPSAIRNLNLYGISHAFSEQSLADGRCRRNAALGEVGFLGGHQLIGDLAIFFIVQHHHQRTQPRAIPRDTRHVDHGNLAKPGLQLSQAGVHHALTLLGCVIFRVLAEVAVSPRLGDLTGQLDPQLILERGDLLLE